VVLDSLGRCMGGKRPCKLCGALFFPTGVRARYCTACNPRALHIVHALNSMLNRCARAHLKQFKAYKGLLVCQEWATDKHAFIVWSISNGWYAGAFIDRIDGSKGYQPDNCRWVSRIENARNRMDKATDLYRRLRRCTCCRIIKPFSSFHNSNSTCAGITYECKECKSSRSSTKR
jgi:hypothetical protein